jgi:hypothetical protein
MQALLLGCDGPCNALPRVAIGYSFVMAFFWPLKYPSASRTGSVLQSMCESPCKVMNVFFVACCKVLMRLMRWMDGMHLLAAEALGCWVAYVLVQRLSFVVFSISWSVASDGTLPVPVLGGLKQGMAACGDNDRLS